MEEELIKPLCGSRYIIVYNGGNVTFFIDFRLTIVHAEENHGGVCWGFGAEVRKGILFCSECFSDLSAYNFDLND